MYKSPRKQSFFTRIFNTVRLKEEDPYQDDEYFDDEEHFEEDLEEGEVYREEHIEMDPPADPEGELGVDMYQTHNAVVIQAITAGVKLSDIDIDLTREHVSIRGTRTPTHRVSDEDFFTQEIYWGAFSRDIQLPFEVDIDEAEAIEDHGLLTITLPKLNKDRRAALKVKSI